MSKITTDLLPLTIDGKIEMVPKRQYLNHRASELTVKFKADIKKSAISDMVDMVAAGKELEEGGEDYDTWKKVYDAVKTDVDLAQEQSALAVEKANAEAEEKKAKEDAAKTRQIELAKVGENTDVAATFASLGEHFDLGNMDRCIPKEGTTDEQLVAALVAGMQMDNFSNWAKGDLVAELEKRGCEGAMVSLCESTGIPYKSIYRMAVTARNVPPENRKPGVSFTTYAEIAMAKFTTAEGKPLPPEANKAKVAELVEKVGEKPAKTGDEKKDAEAASTVITTAQEARKAVQTAQGKQAPAAPDPNAVNMDKDLFIVVNFDGKQNSLATGFPHSLANTDDVEILHAKTGRLCHDYKVKTKEAKWTALPKHTEPAPPAATPAATAPAKGAAAKTAPAAAAAAPA